MRSALRTALFLLAAISLVTGQYYFGRNKIQFHPFDWHVLTTPHFEIYYYKEEKELAAAGAFFAETSFRDLEKKFNFTLIKKIPLIFYSSHLHFQQTNTLPYLIPEGVGGFFEFVKGRVVIPYDGSTYQFKRVIGHELVHVFMHDKVAHILNQHSVTTHRSPPLWFTEGLAEFWSSGWDSRAEMVMRDALLNDYLVPLNRLDLATSGFLLYKEGQSFLRFIHSVYGPEKILSILEGIWKDSDFYRVIELALEDDFDKIVNEWKYWYKKEIYPLMATTEGARVSSEPVTEKGISSAPVYYESDEGEHVIFLTNRTGYSDIYMQGLETEVSTPGPHLLLKGERKAELESLHFLQTGIDVNREGILVFPSKSGPTDILNFFDITHREITHTFRESRIVSISSPSWSPDGLHVVFSGSDWQGSQDLYILETKDSILTQVTSDFYADRDPSFSPDGKSVVFSSDRGQYGDEGYFNLFLYTLENGSIRQLTNGRFNDVSPQWSGQPPHHLAFSSDRDGTHNIWILQGISAGSSPTPVQLTRFATGAFDPHWAGRENQHLLFTSFENFRFQIRMLENAASLVPPAQKTQQTVAGKQAKRWKRSFLTAEGEKKNVPYRRRYTFDIAQTAVAYDPVFGFLGGAQVSMSDLLGNSYYHFLLFNTADRSSDFLERFNFAVIRVDLSRRINIAYGLFHFADDYYNYTDGFFFERRYGIQFALSYPFSVFRRMELASSASKTERSRYFGSRMFTAYLVSNSLSYVFDNSIWSPLGPADGTSIRITLGRTMDFSRSRIYYTALLVDLRKYFRTSLRTLYAVRVMTWLNKGRDVYRYRIGGSWGLRGFELSEVAGTNFFLLNNEFRFPFAEELALRFSSLDVSISPIRGAAFIDVGNAWDESPDRLLASYGLGLRGNLLGAIVLRLDVGRTTESKDPFVQFFFGWNY